MQLPLLTLALAIAAPLADAYRVTASSLSCRTGPGTSYKIVKYYSKNHDVKISCQTNGDSVKGNNIWDKTSDGCYAADYYIKTGSSSMVTKKCPSSGGGGTSTGKSKMNGKISRKEIMSRGQYWVSRHVPYSMSAYYPDPDGKKYRTDCSGFVSMALHASAPGANTVSLPNIAKSITWSQLKPGDFVGTLGAGTGGADGHVTLFHSWANKAKSKYNTLECRGSAGCVKYVRPVGWKVGSHTAKPYRYIHVVD